MPHNELADDRAKLGMMNQRISLRWSRRYATRYGRAEWALISTKSVRRQCMKAAMKRTIAAWKTEKDKKKRLIARGKRLRKNVCSRFLLDWNISLHSAYKPERLAMSRREWSMLSELRGGHVALNGEVKFRFLMRKCMLQRCVGGQRECILHFIFRCRHFLEERRRFEKVVDAVSTNEATTIEADSVGNGAMADGAVSATGGYLEVQIQGTSARFDYIAN